MEEGVGPALARLPGKRQRLVDPRQGAFRASLLGELGEPALEKRRNHLVSLICVRGQGLSKLRHTDHPVAEPTVRPTS